MTKMLRRMWLPVLGALLAGSIAAIAAAISVDQFVVPDTCTASGTTPQTCNSISGAVTTNSLATAAATNAAYVINNSKVVATSRVQCTVQAYSGTPVTNGYPIILSCVPGAGTITANITNTHAANALSGTVIIGFSVQN